MRRDVLGRRETSRWNGMVGAGAIASMNRPRHVWRAGGLLAVAIVQAEPNATEATFTQTRSSRFAVHDGCGCTMQSRRT
jgi:hypothetical protein